LNTPINFGVPALATVFGFIHLLAAGHNWELYYNIKGKSREEIETGTLEFVQKLDKLGWSARLGYLVQKDAFTFIIAIFAVLLFSASSISLMIFQITKAQSLYFAYNSAFYLSLLGLLFFYPFLIFGTILHARGLVNRYRNGELHFAVSNSDTFVEIPLNVVKDALQIAEANKAPVVRIYSSTIEPVGSKLSSATTEPVERSMPAD
jgi:hypothetical protein